MRLAQWRGFRERIFNLLLVEVYADKKDGGRRIRGGFTLISHPVPSGERTAFLRGDANRAG